MLRSKVHEGWIHRRPDSPDKVSSQRSFGGQGYPDPNVLGVDYTA